MAREFKKYGRGEFDSEIKVRKDGQFVLWEDVAPYIYIMEENGSSHNTGSPKCEQCEHYNNESLADICSGCSHFYISRFTLRAGA